MAIHAARALPLSNLADATSPMKPAAAREAPSTFANLLRQNQPAAARDEVPAPKALATTPQATVTQPQAPVPASPSRTTHGAQATRAAPAPSRPVPAASTDVDTATDTEPRADDAPASPSAHPAVKPKVKSADKPVAASRPPATTPAPTEAQPPGDALPAEERPAGHAHGSPMAWLAEVPPTGATPGVDAVTSAASAQLAGEPAGSATMSTGPNDAGGAAAAAGRREAGARGEAGTANAAATGAAAPGASLPAALTDAAMRTSSREAAPPMAPLLNDMPPAVPAALAPSPPAAGPTPPAAAPVAVDIGVPVTSADFPRALGVQLSVLAQGGVQRAELHLNPAEMGPVSVQIVMQGHEAQVDFGADLAATRDAIEAGLPELAGALRDAGFTLTGGGVSEHARGGGDDDRHAAERGRGRAGDTEKAGHGATAAPTLRRSVSAGGVDLYA